MKLFQAALEHRKSITITTDEAKALDEECVVVASSLTMLEFIANMLPVSLRCVRNAAQPTSMHIAASSAAVLQIAASSNSAAICCISRRHAA